MFILRSVHFNSRLHVGWHKSHLEWGFVGCSYCSIHWHHPSQSVHALYVVRSISYKRCIQRLMLPPWARLITSRTCPIVDLRLVCQFCKVCNSCWYLLRYWCSWWTSCCIYNIAHVQSFNYVHILWSQPGNVTRVRVVAQIERVERTVWRLVVELDKFAITWQVWRIQPDGDGMNVILEIRSAFCGFCSARCTFSSYQDAVRRNSSYFRLMKFFRLDNV
mgnify:CR=1 FL=1